MFSSLATKQAPSVSRGRSACNPFLLRHPTHTFQLQWCPDGRGWVGRDIEWRKLGKPGIQSHTPAEDIAMSTPQGPAMLPGNSPRTSEEGGPLSPRWWTEIQRDDDADAWGQPVCEDMVPLTVVGGMDMGEPLWKDVCR